MSDGKPLTFRDRHAGESLPPYGKRPEEKTETVEDGLPDAGLIPLSIQDMVIPVTEQEALGIIGQITAILQSRRTGVFKNA